MSKLKVMFDTSGKLATVWRDGAYDTQLAHQLRWQRYVPSTVVTCELMLDTLVVTDAGCVAGQPLSPKATKRERLEVLEHAASKLDDAEWHDGARVCIKYPPVRTKRIRPDFGSDASVN